MEEGVLHHNTSFMRRNPAGYLHCSLLRRSMQQRRTSVACVVRLVPYSSSVGILLLLLPLPPPTLTVSWLSPTMRITCGAHAQCFWSPNWSALSEGEATCNSNVQAEPLP